MEVEVERSTRERILDVALDLFVEQGYDKTSLREIAEKMGFSKAALYYHFASKADILMALHQRMHSALDDLLPALESAPANVNVWEAFLSIGIDRMLANRKLFQLHQVNQAALEKIHNEDHSGQHIDMEERVRKLFSDENVPARQTRPDGRLVCRRLCHTPFGRAFVPRVGHGRSGPHLAGRGPRRPEGLTT